MAQFHDRLIDAVGFALQSAQHDVEHGYIDGATHLMAQRREHGSDGNHSHTWAVVISDEFDRDFLTHLSDNPADCGGSPADVAARIESMWDADWDEIPRSHPAGDFSVGSSDYVTRSEAAEWAEFPEMN